MSIFKTIAASTLAVGLAFAGVTAAEAAPRVNEKVTICHRTHATTNPYRKITVSMSSIVGNGNSGNGHGDTTTGNNSHNPYNSSAGRVFNPTFSYPANQKQWQDIIPPFNYVPANGNPGSFAGLNWTDEGKAIYYGYTLNGHDYSGLCGKMSAKDFANVENAAMVADNPNANTSAKNTFKNNILKDVKDQAADEDGTLTGKTFDTLPDPAQKPKGPKIPPALKTLQETLDTTNSSLTEKTQAIAGVVWLDADKDGVQDDAETEFENVEIKLYDPITGQEYIPARLRSSRIGIAANTPLVVYTDANGFFQINNVPEGDWTVKVVTPSGYTYTYDSTGTGDGQMPGTYVPTGGLGFAWAGLVTDPGTGGTGGGTDPGTGGTTDPGSENNGTDSLANTGSNDLYLGITGLLLISLGTVFTLRRK